MKFVVAEKKKKGHDLLDWDDLVDSDYGYLKDQHITVGVHMQVQHQVWLYK